MRLAVCDRSEALSKSFAVSALLIMAAIWSFPQSRSEPAARGEATLPYAPSLDSTSMDRSVDPCENFYQYSCGGWQDKNPIPPDQTSWSVYGKLYQDNLQFLRGILEDAAHAKQSDAVSQKIGEYYAACMDEPSVNRRGMQAIEPELAAIAAVKSVRELAPLVARLLLEA